VHAEDADDLPPHAAKAPANANPHIDRGIMSQERRYDDGSRLATLAA
jgi:hypothetical protein